MATNNQDRKDLDRSTPSQEVGHESRDVEARVYIYALLAIVVLTVFMNLFLSLVFWSLDRNEKKVNGERPPMLKQLNLPKPPPPRLQISPRHDLEELHAREDEELNSYGWISPEQGIVRLPIQKAMDLIVQRGLPTKNSSTGSEKPQEKERP